MPITEILLRSAARCLAFVAAELIFEMIALLPALLGLPSTAALWGLAIAAYFASDIAFAALNCIYMPTLANEPIGPISALQRTFNLASGHWLRILVLGLMIMLSGWILMLGLSFVLRDLIIPIAISLVGSIDFYLEYVGPAMKTLLSAVEGLAYGLRLIFTASIATAAYHLLQQAKEGRPTHEMAQVFD